MSPSAPTTAARPTTPITVQLIGGPTALIEIGGLRLLTDPTFDPPGDHPVGQRNLVKTTSPAIAAETIGRVDAVLLSHDQHPDNLDDAGRQLLARVPLVLSTASAQHRLGGATRELPVWRSTTLPRPDGGELRITGVPAQHGPAGTEHLTGEVRGFVLSGDRLPTVYISGDNASLAVVREVADHAGPIDIAVLFAGHARSPLMDAYLTFSSDQTARAAEILGAPTVIPIHLEGWGHLTQEPGAMPDAFARRGLSDRLLMLRPGERAALP
ncbi:MAG TPA: MBL fold metallo-hydrolase [Pseudonocardia sp.]|jgi:L-ascorbate metabolism protein UlaG (beta-lactamase superfamily)